MWVRASRSLDLATYASTGLMGLIGVLGLADPLAQAAAAGLCLASGLLYRFGLQRARAGLGVHLYFAAQTAVVAALLATRSRNFDAFIFLYFLLAIQASVLLARRAALAWLAAFYLVSCLAYLWRDPGRVLIPILFNAAVFLLSGTYGRALREAELARQHNESLMEALRAAQGQLQALAISEERNRLARDLHDTAKQQAFALSAQLGAARGLMGRDPARAEERLRQAEELADTLRQELANLVVELRPAAASEQGLAAALRAHAASWSRASEIEALVEVRGERALPREVEDALYRIAQEALANVARHSRARRATILLDFGPQAVQLRVEDDGPGFDPGQTPPGVGLQSMQERAALLPGGALRLDSAPGRGTRLSVTCEC
jgi:signal transduction histidine kinase